jgi:two-component system, response regulator RegA
MVDEVKRKSTIAGIGSLIAGAGRPGPSPSVHASADSAPAARPKTFLVVDDQARGAPCSADALALARISPPEAATVDLRMPGGAASGLDLIRDLLALAPRIQIVVLTGYGNIATAVEAVRRGAIDYLTKPLDTDQILAAFDPAAARATDAATELTPTLARVEWEHIQRILTDCNGNISKAARKLGLHRRSLQRKLSKLPPEE